MTKKNSKLIKSMRWWIFPIKSLKKNFKMALIKLTYIIDAEIKINTFRQYEKVLVMPLKNPPNLRIKSTFIDLSRSEMQ